jgi:hypothetical protein
MVPKKRKKEMTWCETNFCTKIYAKTSFDTLLHFFGSFLHERASAQTFVQPTQGLYIYIYMFAIVNVS